MLAMRSTALGELFARRASPCSLLPTPPGARVVSRRRCAVVFLWKIIIPISTNWCTWYRQVLIEYAITPVTLPSATRARPCPSSGRLSTFRRSREFFSERTFRWDQAGYLSTGRKSSLSRASRLRCWTHRKYLGQTGRLPFVSRAICPGIGASMVFYLFRVNTRHMHK